MSFGLGFWAAAGAGGGAAAGAYELISTTLLGSSAASVTFTNAGAWSGYKHLQIRAVAQTTGTGGDNIDLTFNADTGNNYSYHSLYGNGSSVGSEANTPRANMAAVVPVTGSSTAANQFSASVIDILDFQGTKNKTVRYFAGRPISSYTFVHLASGAWFNTAALTSITLTGRSNNIAANSRFSLYGIKG